MKRIFLMVLLALTFVFVFDGKTYAQAEKPVLLQASIDPLASIEKPEIEKVAEEKEKIAEEVEEKSEKLEDTAEAIKTIETKANTLTSEIEAKKQEIEVLKQRVAEKNAGGLGGGDEGTVAVAQAPAPAPVYAGPNTYDVGQCTWHVKNLKPNLPNGLGNTDEWYWNAVAMGVPAGTEARPGAAAPRKVGMHVVYVMEVYADGTMLISEMNYDYVPHHQRTAIKNQSDFYYIY